MISKIHDADIVIYRYRVFVFDIELEDLARFQIIRNWSAEDAPAAQCLQRSSAQATRLAGGPFQVSVSFKFSNLNLYLALNATFSSRWVDHDSREAGRPGTRNLKPRAGPQAQVTRQGQLAPETPRQAPDPAGPGPVQTVAGDLI